MSQGKRSSLGPVVGSLGWPILLGLASASGFYVALFQGPLRSPALLRYFASHPVSYVATCMFFVGLASLALRFLDVLGQMFRVNTIELPETEGGQAAEASSDLLDCIEELPTRARRSRLGRRLHDALDHVERTGSAENIGDELKYLADADAVTQHESYSLARIIIWATPMLGFLGTVIGITKALGDLDSSQMANSIETAMDQLLSGLYIAFDTTALALSLSIILMFIQFLVERVDNNLMAIVDERVNHELTGRFETSSTAMEPHVGAVMGMSREVIQATELLVQRQSEVWQATIDAAHEQWSALVTTAGGQIESSLASALDQSIDTLSTSLDDTIDRLSDKLATAEKESADLAGRRWEQWQTALSDNARMLQAQQVEMVKQGDVLRLALEATGDVMKLEQALNHNLHTLSGSANFEETVISLSAAIHLLNAKLNATAPTVDLRNKTSDEKAA